jgi:hypothetical protein
MKYVIHDFEWAAPMKKAATLPEVVVIEFPDDMDEDDAVDEVPKRLLRTFGHRPVDDDFSFCEYDEWSGRDAFAQEAFGVA